MNMSNTGAPAPAPRSGVARRASKAVPLLVAGALTLGISSMAPATPLKAATASAAARASVPVGPVEDVAHAPAGIGRRPALVTDDAGTTTAVWRQVHDDAEGAEYAVVRAARRGPQGAWSRPRTLGCGRLESCPASNPRLGVDGDGDVTVVWLSGTTVLAATRTQGVGWRAPRAIGTTSGEVPDNSWGLAVARNGSAFVVWSSPADGVVWAARRTDDGRWGPPREVAGGADWDVEIGASDRGAAVVAFIAASAPQYGDTVQAARFVPGSGWTRATPVGDHLDGHVALAVGRRGDAVLLWRAGLWRLTMRASVMSPSGRWTLPDRLGGVYYWAVSEGAAIDSSGTATVAWIDYRDDHGTPNPGYVATRTPRGTWSRMRTTGNDGTAYIEPPLPVLVNRSDDTAVILPERIHLRPRHGTWSSAAIGASTGAIMPSGAVLRMWWSPTGLKAQQVGPG